MIFFFFSLLLSPVYAASQVLPDIFYATPREQQALCASAEVHTIEFWSTLMSDKFEQELARVKLDGLEKDVYRNQLVTLSYLGLYEQAGSEMGYVYANASHHLGRLVRDSYWSKLRNQEHLELARADRALIRGATLGQVSQIFPRTLSSQLMFHSVQLYKTLSWSLAADALCGRIFIQDLLRKETCHECAGLPGLSASRHPQHMTLLRQAFEAEDFSQAFVVFEQSFLQFTMYQTFIIAGAARSGVLDPMRFISFNGEKQLAFDEWCKKTNCRKTSADLAARTLFDQTVIAQEWQITKRQRDRLTERLRRSRIKDVARVILKHLGL